MEGTVCQMLTGKWMALKYDLQDISKRLDESHQAYKEAKTHPEVWRDSFLESLAQAKAEKMGLKYSKSRKSSTWCQNRGNQQGISNGCVTNLATLPLHLKSPFGYLA
jgi:hypothetical protein